MFIYTCLSKIHMLKPKFIWLSNMTVFRDGAFKELIKVKEGYKHGAPIQYDWYVHKKRERERPGLYVLREKVTWEHNNTVAVFQEKGNGLRRNQICWPIDVEHLTSRIVRNKFLLFKPPRLCYFVMEALKV